MKWCIETELIELVDWFRANGLTLNLNKTVCILFGTTKLLNKNDLDTISLGDITVQISDKVKFLGIWLDKEFNYHTNQLLLKIKRNTTMLRISLNE